MDHEERGRVDDPVDILERRLASGEIDRREYEEIRRHISSGRVSGRGSASSLSRPGIVVLIVLGVVVAFTATSLALTYGPWRSLAGGQLGWGNCCNWGGPGGMGGGMMGEGMMGGYGNYDVAIVNYAFRPQQITVQQGTTLTWVNMDGVMHTVSFGAHGDEHIEMDSGAMYHMGAWSYTFNEPGTYEYHCDPHPYMTGTVIVEG